MNITTAKRKKPLSKKHALRAAELLQKGWGSHQAGNIQEAQGIYQSILDKYPNYPDAAHLLGLIAHQLGQYDLAIMRFEQTLSIKSNFAEAHLNLGDALQKTGQWQNAISHFEQAIAIKPDFAEAHYNLGNTYHVLGQLDKARSHFYKAITIKPDFAEAHYNLGNTLNALNLKKDAITHFKKSLAIKPNVAEVHNNIGDVLQQLGETENAIAEFKYAIQLKPDFSEAYNNLGNIFLSQDRKEEAVSYFNQAIKLKPDFAEAHYNLASIQHSLGQLDCAITHIKNAIDIKPDFAEAYNKLGQIYREQGKLLDDYNCQRHAISLNRDNDFFWQSFARSLETLSFTSVDDALWQDMSDLLDRPGLSPKTFTNAIISTIRCHPEFIHVFNQINTEEANKTSYKDTANRLSSIPLLEKLMCVSTINDLEIEKMLTAVRRSMLLSAKSKVFNNNEKTITFSSALALLCFTNEYIFYESEEEIALIEEVEEEIKNMILNGTQIPSSLLVALACYRSLYTYTWSENILEYDYPETIRFLIERQIKFPMEEASLRKQIRNLTPIQNATSQLVRGQYEENPYPLWTKAGLFNKSMTIKNYLQASPLRFKLDDYISPENPEILIAGCGTGQHALKTATLFSNSKVLALDLSLTSLAYAKRKTQELGVSNIEYGQADIMELDILNRHFDLIESVGVLHHLKDPIAGWKILTNLLRSNGVMKIGLYSETARPDVINGRKLIDEKGYTSSPDDIRKCRQEIINLAAKGNLTMAKLLSFSDFFHLSELRDLIFHVQEHRFTIPEIEENLKTLDLQFLGFELNNQNAMFEFKNNFPEESALTSLNNWHQFETQNPDTFRGMYQFWVQKK